MTLVTNRSASMSSGLLLDPMPSPSLDSSPTGPRYRPFASPNHHVTKGRYITSNDPRGYIPVYEYPLNGQWIMLDMDDGYVLWTGIWKALGNSKADIVKMIESQPDLAPQLRRVRGGYLKIQGTWMPYEIALRLARRVSWPIRYELVPLFGPTFPGTCLSPDQPGFGQIVKPGTGKRRSRRNLQAANMPESKHDWTVISPAPHSLANNITQYSAGPPDNSSNGLRGYSSVHPHRRHSDPDNRHHAIQEQQCGSPIALHSPYGDQWNTRPTTATTSSSHNDAGHNIAPIATEHSASMRYSPYPSPLSARPRTYPGRSDQSGPFPSPPVPRLSPSDIRNAPFGDPENITLPPIKPPSERDGGGRGVPLKLPPISSMDQLCEGHRCDDSTTVLRRLRSSNDDILRVGLGVAGNTSTIPDMSRKLSVTEASHNLAPDARVPSMRLPTSAQTASASTSPFHTPSMHHSSSVTSQSPTSSHLHTPYSTRSSLDDVRGAYHSPHGERVGVSKAQDEDSSSVYRARLEQCGIPHVEGVHNGRGDDHLPDPTRHSWRPW